MAAGRVEIVEPKLDMRIDIFQIGPALFRSQKGLSLVETIVAGAIMAIAALILVSFVYTISGVSQRSTDIAKADETLTETIAINPEDRTSSDTMSITLGDSTITTTHNTYESKGRILSTFELPAAPTGTTP